MDSISINPQCGNILGFNLTNGWYLLFLRLSTNLKSHHTFGICFSSFRAGAIDLISLSLTHGHCPPSLIPLEEYFLFVNIQQKFFSGFRMVLISFSDGGPIYSDRLSVRRRKSSWSSLGSVRGIFKTFPLIFLNYTLRFSVPPQQRVIKYFIQTTVLEIPR